MIEQNKSKNISSIQTLYGKEGTLTTEKFISEYNINPNGLTSEEASKKILKDGYNEIKSTKPKRWYNYLFESLFSPFNCILLRNSWNTVVYRCILTTQTKLCKYTCYNYIGNCKYFTRIF